VKRARRRAALAHCSKKHERWDKRTPRPRPLELQVLLKGVYARPVPILIESDVEEGTNSSTLRIDDRWGGMNRGCAWQSLTKGGL